MQKNCSHCGIDYQIDFAGLRPDLQWAFAKCFGCHGLTLVDSRKGSPSMELPEIVKKTKSYEAIPIPLPELELPPKFVESTLRATLQPTTMAATLATTAATAPESVPIQFYLKQAAVVVLFIASVSTLRWALTGENHSMEPVAVTPVAQAPAAPAVVAKAVAPQAAVPAAVTAPDASAAVQAEPLATVRVIAPDVILRAGPGMQYSKVLSVAENSRLTVRKHQGDWLEVDLATGGSAWVRNNLVSVL